MPHAWHSTNPDFLMGLRIDVADTLRKVLPMFETPPPNPSVVEKAGVPDMPQLVTAAMRARLS